MNSTEIYEFQVSKVLLQQCFNVRMNYDTLRENQTRLGNIFELSPAYR
jgi:hypothetical protein